MRGTKMAMDWMTVLSYTLVGFILLLVLWPTTAGGRRVLKRWGVGEADDEQAKLAVKYLRDRRLLYPPLFLLSPLLLPSEWGPDIVAAGIAALLVAEAIAALRPARGPRAAGLTPRTWGGLVQRWAIAAMVLLG